MIQQKELTLKEKLNPEMRLRLYKETLRKLDKRERVGKRAYHDTAQVLRSSMVNMLFTVQEASISTMDHSLYEYFPEMHNYVDSWGLLSDSFWSDPENFQNKIETLRDLIFLMENNKSVDS